MIPYGRQEITQEDIEAVTDVLRSDYLTQGPVVKEFEDILSSFVGSKHAIAFNSATSALHISCLALNLSPKDWLWTSPISFVASANCGLYCGAQIDFVDIDPHTYNMCTVALEKKLKIAEKEGKLPKVLVAVHLCGQSCNMESIYNLSKKFCFKVIEDASHAIGGRYKGEYIGNCRYSDITVFSFHPVKIITTAEGGMAVTNCNILANKLSSLRSHGITRESSQMTHLPDGPWYYQQLDLGFNYRMTEIQAALGVSQFKRLENYVSRRHELATRYNLLLSKLPVKLPWQNADCFSSFHLYVIRLDLDVIKKTRLQVFEEMRAQGIGVNIHYIPIHTQPYYQRLDVVYQNLIEAEKYYSDAISLPLFPSLSNSEQDFIIDVIEKVIS